MSRDDPSLSADSDARRQELTEALARLEERVVAACTVANRPRAEVTVIAVTKTFPASDVMHLAALGLTDVGENRAAEVADKELECRAAGVTELRWHFLGQLQTNKAGVVAECCDVVHSVDRLKLVTALDRGAERAGRRLRCLVQVDLDTGAGDDAGSGHDAARGGAAPGVVAAIADALATAQHVGLAGVMAVAPLGGDPADAFARLAKVAAEVQSQHPGATVISAGMSGDLEEAVIHGATHLRVGRALLGSRPPLG